MSVAKRDTFFLGRWAQKTRGLVRQAFLGCLVQEWGGGGAYIHGDRSPWLPRRPDSSGATRSMPRSVARCRLQFELLNLRPDGAGGDEWVLIHKHDFHSHKSALTPTAEGSIRLKRIWQSFSRVSPRDMTGNLFLVSARSRAELLVRCYRFRG